MIEEKNFSKLVELTEVVGYQQMVINNQPMRQEVRTTNVCCPECSMPILDFPYPRDDVLMRRYFLDNPGVYPNFCPKCGQKIIFAYEVVDGKFEVLSEEQVNEDKGGDNYESVGN